MSSIPHSIEYKKANNYVNKIPKVGIKFCLLSIIVYVRMSVYVYEREKEKTRWVERQSIGNFVCFFYV